METGPQRMVTIGSLLAAGRAAAIAVAAAGVFLTSSTAAPAAAQGGAPLCAACHGTHGEGAASGVPRLAGQNVDYLSHALATFKAGTRASTVMQPVAQNLSDAEMRRLADYFSRQNAPLADAAASPSPQTVLAGRQLAETGAANVAACFSCHAEQGKGNGARFPRIAGQPAQFVISRLHEFQARARGKTPEPGTMTAVAATLDERQIERLPRLPVAAPVLTARPDTVMTALNDNPRLGFIGMGGMGSRMAARLLAAGYDVTIYNRIAERTRLLEEQGAKVVPETGDLAAIADIVLSSLADDAAVEKVIGGALVGARPGTVLIEMSTVSPVLSRRMYELAREKGVFVLDAPVSGTITAAEQGQLVIFVGGDRVLLRPLPPRSASARPGGPLRGAVRVRSNHEALRQYSAGAGNTGAR